MTIMFVPIRPSRRNEDLDESEETEEHPEKVITILDKS